MWCRNLGTQHSPRKARNMFTHSKIKTELDSLMKEAEKMEKSNAQMAEHGRGSQLVDHIVALTRVVKMLADAQRIGF